MTEKEWEYVDSVPGSFTRLNAEKLYEYAVQVRDLIVEVGVDQGRSTSVLCFAARQRRRTFGTSPAIYLIDSWESVLIENMTKVYTRLTEDFDVINWQIFNKRSVEAAKALGDIHIDLVHIDANHHGDNPENDCKSWLPRLKSGGVACFHDYGASFPAVTDAVDKHTSGWEDLGVWDSLAIRRKP